MSRNGENKEKGLEYWLPRVAVAAGLTYVGYRVYYGYLKDEKKGGGGDTGDNKGRTPAEDKRIADGESAGTVTNPSTWPKNKPMSVGDYIQSPNKKAFVILQPTGALELFKGSSPSDPSAMLYWTTGVRINEDSRLGVFAELKDNGNLFVRHGTATNVGDVIWKREVNGTYDDVFIRVADDVRMHVVGKKDGQETIIWDTPLVANTVEMGRPMMTGNWIQSENKQFYAIQTDTGQLEIRRGNNPSVPDGGTLIWTSRDTSEPAGRYFTIIQSDGHLVTYTGTPSNQGRAIFMTGVHPEGRTGLKLVLTNEGRLVESDGRDDVIWTSPLPTRAARRPPVPPARRGSLTRRPVAAPSKRSAA